MPNPLYEPYNQTTSRQPATAPQFDLNAAIMAFLQQQQAAQTDRLKLQGEQSFGRDLGWANHGGLTPQSQWDTMFPSYDERIGREYRRLGQWGQTGVEAGLAPRQVNPEQLARQPLGTVIPEPTQAPQGFSPTTRAIPGGYEGMINPQVQGAAKYADANMFTARPKKTKYKPPTTAFAPQSAYAPM